MTDAAPVTAGRGVRHPAAGARSATPGRRGACRLTRSKCLHELFDRCRGQARVRAVGRAACVPAPRQPATTRSPAAAASSRSIRAPRAPGTRPRAAFHRRRQTPSVLVAFQRVQRREKRRVVLRRHQTPAAFEDQQVERPGHAPARDGGRRRSRRLSSAVAHGFAVPRRVAVAYAVRGRARRSARGQQRRARRASRWRSSGLGSRRRSTSAAAGSARPCERDHLRGLGRPAAVPW